MLRHGDDFVTKYDRSSLRTLGSVGEPINLEAWKWYNNVVGDKKCEVVDTWWQTETGGNMITPRPAAKNSHIEPAIAQRPFYGIKPVLITSDQKNVTDDYPSDGALCMANPWPGMARTVYGDHKRFFETYYSPFPGYYFSGDGAVRTKDGWFQITGRMDDVINISGHRLSTAEIESVLTEDSRVGETAVIGCPHDIKGETPFAYIILKEGVTLEDEAKFETG